EDAPLAGEKSSCRRRRFFQRLRSYRRRRSADGSGLNRDARPLPVEKRSGSVGNGIPFQAQRSRFPGERGPPREAEAYAACAPAKMLSYLTSIRTLHEIRGIGQPFCRSWPYGFGLGIKQLRRFVRRPLS